MEINFRIVFWVIILVKYIDVFVGVGIVMFFWGKNVSGMFFIDLVYCRFIINVCLRFFFFIGKGIKLVLFFILKMC